MYFTDRHKRYRSKQLGHKYTTLQDMLTLQSSDVTMYTKEQLYKRQLYTVTLFSWDEKFLRAIKRIILKSPSFKGEIVKIPGIEYLTDATITEILGVNLKNYDKNIISLMEKMDISLSKFSDVKILLKSRGFKKLIRLFAFYYTPVCYLETRRDLLNLLNREKEQQLIYEKSMIQKADDLDVYEKTMALLNKENDVCNKCDHNKTCWNNEGYDCEQVQEPKN